MHPKLKEFLVIYLAFAEGLIVKPRWMDSSYGLCSNYVRFLESRYCIGDGGARYALRRALTLTFGPGFNPYPFDGSQHTLVDEKSGKYRTYMKDAETRNHHTNPARLAWIRKELGL